MLIAAAAGLLLLAAFVTIERRSRDPLLPPQLLANQVLSKIFNRIRDPGFSGPTAGHQRCGPKTQAPDVSSTPGAHRLRRF
jgi:hypothetical protein